MHTLTYYRDTCNTITLMISVWLGVFMLLNLETAQAEGRRNLQDPLQCLPQSVVGQTGRTLAQRLKEHKLALVSGHLAQSAVAEHAAQEPHDIDWEGATVTDVQQQYHQRCLLESWHIQSELNMMNRNKGNLPPVYDLLVRQSHSSD